MNNTPLSFDNLPPELINLVLSYLTSGFDVFNMTQININIKRIIIDELNTIVENLIKNNHHNNKLHISWIYHVFYKMVKTDDKNKNYTLFLFILQLINKETEQILENNFKSLARYNPNGDTIIIYYYLRFRFNFEHTRALSHISRLNIIQLTNMIRFLKQGFTHDNALNAATVCTTNAKIQKMFELMARNIPTEFAIEIIKEEFSDVRIERTFELISRNIPVDVAINASELNDEELERMFLLINRNLDADTAYRASIFTSEEDIEEMFRYISLGVVPYVACTAANYVNRECGRIYVYMCQHGIDEDDAKYISDNFPCDFKRIIFNLINKGIDNHEDICFVLDNIEEDEIEFIMNLLEQNNIMAFLDEIENDDSKFRQLINLIKNNVPFDEARIMVLA